MKTLKKILFYFSLFTLICLYFSIKVFHQVNIYDEGFIVYVASRILNGEIPYRDFWAIYAPGQFYIVAVLFKIFGEYILVERIYDIIIRALIPIVIFSIVKNRSPRLISILILIISVVLINSVEFFGYALYPALLLSLLAIRSHLKYFDTLQKKYFYISAFLAGVVVIFRLDVGIYLLITILVSNTLNLIVNRSDGKTTLLKIIKFSALYFILFILPLAPVLSYFLLTGSLYEAYSQVLVFPLTKLHKVRHLPYPPLIPSVFTLSQVRNTILFYLPIIFYLIVSIYSVIVLMLKKFKGIFIYELSFSLVLGSFLFLQAMSRADTLHFIPTVLMFFLTLGVLYNSIKSKIFKYMYYCFLFLFVFVFTVPEFFNTLKRVKYLPSYQCPNQLAKASCAMVDQSQVSAIEYIQRNTNGAIYVGNIRHDKIFINDIMFYFLSGRNSATKYHEIYPGVATTLEVQKEIEEQIKRESVEYIVLLNAFEEVNEPNESSISSQVTYLDDFIRSNYSEVQTYGSYVILKKN